MPSKICSEEKYLLFAAAPPARAWSCCFPSVRQLRHALATSVACLVLTLTASAQDPVIIRPPDGPAYREGRILVIPKAGRAAALGRFHSQTGARLRKAFPKLANIQVLELPRGLSARDAIARYRQSGHAEVAELDYWIEASTSPNDPNFINGDQWHLNNFGQAGGQIGRASCRERV